MKPTINVLFYEPYPMGLGGNFLTQRLILDRIDRAQFTPIVVAPVEGVALEEFRKMGIECVVISPPRSLARYGGTVLRDGILGRLKTSISLLRYNLKFLHFLRERQIDIVYANCVRAEMSIGLAARLIGVPSLLYIKGELANPVIDRMSLLLASKVLFFCEQNRDDKYRSFVRALQKKVDILKIGLDFSVIEDVQKRDKTALAEELGIDPTCTNVIVVAQLYQPKGQHLVIEALSKLTVDFPKVKLYLVGDHVIAEYKSYRLELDRMIEEYGLQKNVQFTGWRSDALHIVSLMDILIHPSLSEGFGRAVLEGMALGKPVIASSVGGLREIIKDGENGFLVEPGDPQMIAEKLRLLLRNKNLRDNLGKAARDTVFSEYLIQDKIVQLEEIWSDMACGK
jgi:glycosyltransferase involved in cell wall biosynthesis